MNERAILARDLIAALRRKHSRELGWCVVDELEISPGRRVDALAVCVYPSRGFLRLGFEIKVDRRDWLKELQDPAKAEAAFAQVHAFWVVSAPDVVRIEELPPGWGLLEGRRRGEQVVLRCLRPAASRPELEVKDLRTEVLCRIVRRVWDQDREEAKARAKLELDQELRQEITKLQAQLDQARRHRDNQAMEARSERDAVLAEFEAGFGAELSRRWAPYRPREVGALARLLIAAQGDAQVKRLAEAADDCRRAAEAMDQARAKLQQTAATTASPDQDGGPG